MSLLQLHANPALKAQFAHIINNKIILSTIDMCPWVYRHIFFLRKLQQNSS